MILYDYFQKKIYTLKMEIDETDGNEGHDGHIYRLKKN